MARRAARPRQGRKSVQGSGDGHDDTKSGPKRTLTNELLRLDLRDRFAERSQGLPGVPEERQFHRFYPDLLVPNSILRQCLREDHRLEHEPSLQTKLGLDQIALCSVLGDQSRLHDAIAIVSHLRPDILHFALLATDNVHIKRQDSSHTGQVTGIRSGTRGQCKLAHHIVEISSVHGSRAPLLLIRTEYEVHCVALSIRGALRDNIVEARTLQRITFMDLRGHRPLACRMYRHNDLWTIVVVCTNGYLRIWSSSQRQKVCAGLAFVISSTMQIHRGSTVLAILRPNNDENVLLLVHASKVVSIDLDNTVSMTRLNLREGEQIVVAKSAFVEQLAQAILCLVTTHRVQIHLIKHAQLSLAKSWKHSLTNLDHVAVHENVVASMIQIRLQLVDTNFSILYQHDLATPNKNYSPSCSKQPVDVYSPLLSFPVEIQSLQDELQPSCFIYTNEKSTLIRTIRGDEDDDISSTDKDNAPIAPARIDTDDEISTDDHDSREVAKAGPTLDMSGLYRDYVQGLTKTACKVESGKAIDTKSMTLGSKVYQENNTGDSFDEQVEACMSRYQEQGFSVIETPGLKLCDAFDASKPDGNTAESIEERLQPWLGQNPAFADRHARGAIRRAAQSLSLSAVSICKAADLSTLLDGVRVRGSKRQKPTKAWRRLMGEWRIGDDVKNYQWESMNSAERRAKAKKYVIREIPPFRPLLPPVVVSSQPRLTQPAGQDDLLGISTQPVKGKYGERKVKKKKRRIPGF